MKPRKWFGLLLLSILCLGALACSGSLFRSYGRILPGEETDLDMEGGVLHLDLCYYISGSDLYPNALIGLHRNYRLDRKTLWREVDMTPAKLLEIVGLMKAKALEHGQFPHGFDLLDTEGNKIGIWYSIMKARTFLRFEEDGTVMILTPKLETYDELDGSGSEGLWPGG